MSDRRQEQTALVPAGQSGGVGGLRDAMMPQSFDQLLRFADMVAATSFVPQAYKGKPGEIVAAVTYGAEIGLSPMQSLRSIAVINGTPALYGDGPLAVCQSHPQWAGKDEWFEGEGDDLTAFCTVRRKGETDVTGQFSVADAKKAQLSGKAGPWQQYPKRMLQMRARGFALRDQFADALRGLVSEHEAGDMPAYGPDRAKDVTPQEEAKPEPRGSKLDRFAEKHARNGNAPQSPQEPAEREEASEVADDTGKGDSARPDEAGGDEAANATAEGQDELADVEVMCFLPSGKKDALRTIPEAEAWLERCSNHEGMTAKKWAGLLEHNKPWISGLPEIRRNILVSLFEGVS